MKRLLTFAIALLLSICTHAQFIGDHYTDIMRKCQYLKPITIDNQYLIYKDTITGWEYGYGFDGEHVCKVACYNVPDSDFIEVFNKADSIFNFSRPGAQKYYDTYGPWVMELVKIQDGYTALSFVDYGLYMYLHTPKRKDIN